MGNASKNLRLVAALIIIGGIIWYIESAKPEAPAVPAEKVAAPVADTSTDRRAILQEKTAKYPSAIELIPGGKFINTDPIKLKDLIGRKVILIDFWTYSCINCLRTLPYLKSWYAKYKDQGLEIIGVHTPEFDFEKDYANVSKAVADLGITYPVMQDNDYATWTAYNNLYWPREYLIDIDGYIIHDHAGEGDYDNTEKYIQQALKERAQVLHTAPMSDTTATVPADEISVDASQVGSPETYFGSGRNEYLGNGQAGVPGSQNMQLPQSPNLNALYLGGSWNFSEQFAENSSAGAEVEYKYNSKNVYFVASSNTGAKVEIFVDDKPAGTIDIKDHKLYQLVNGKDYGQHVLRLKIDDPGLDAFTFTFG